MSRYGLYKHKSKQQLSLKALLSSYTAKCKSRFCVASTSWSEGRCSSRCISKISVECPLVFGLGNASILKSISKETLRWFTRTQTTYNYLFPSDLLSAHDNHTADLMLAPLLPCGFGVAQFWFLGLCEVSVHPDVVLVSTLIILTTWLAIVFFVSSSLWEPLAQLALSASSSNVELSGYSLDSELSVSSSFLFGLELGSGVLPARRAFNCQVMTTRLGLAPRDAASSTSSQLLESMTGVECVVASDIKKK